MVRGEAVADADSGTGVERRRPCTVRREQRARRLQHDWTTRPRTPNANSRHAVAQSQDLQRPPQRHTLAMSAPGTDHPAVAAIRCGREPHAGPARRTARSFGWGGRWQRQNSAGNSGIQQYAASAIARRRSHSPRGPRRHCGGPRRQSRPHRKGSGRHMGCDGRRHRGPAFVRSSRYTALLDGIDHVRAIAAGEFLFGAIDAAGRIHTWGLNADGALGRPTARLNATPGIVEIACCRPGGWRSARDTCSHRRRTAASTRGVATRRANSVWVT